MVCCLESCEVLLAECPRGTPVELGLYHLGRQHAHPPGERSGRYIVQLPLEPFVACRRESDPSFDPWHDIGACVD